MELDYQKDPSLFARLIDDMPVGFFTVDAAGNFVSWSDGAERITGHARSEVIGKRCTFLKGTSCRGFAGLMDMLADPNFAATGSVSNLECKVLSKDGRELYLHGNVRLIAYDQHLVEGAIGYFSDLTEFVLTTQKVTLLEEQTRQRDAFEKLIGNSGPMKEIFRRLRLAARSDVTVCISGESGTGKELAARAIHSVSERGDQPFFDVNCSAIPETLLESELFGHVKGAFTSAVLDKIGLFQAANGGTLFLDEIGDISPSLQLKLLRVLEEREIRRVGDDKAIEVDVRVLAATSKNLKDLMSRCEFRADFYDRIHGFDIYLPPLRERREDVALLARRFMMELSRTRNLPVDCIARDALQRMMDYSWPGNVRELRYAIEHAFITVHGNTITLFDLPIEIRKSQSVTPRSDSDSKPEAIRTTAPATIPLTELSPKQLAEREHILSVLQQTGGNKTAAARILGFSRVTMWKKVSKYGIQ